jgi:hypothetical protein
MLTSRLDLPQWSKNWYSSSESLWFDRWQQVLDIMPDFVEIITCKCTRFTNVMCDSSDILQGTTTASRAIYATRILAKWFKVPTNTSLATTILDSAPSCRTSSKPTRLATVTCLLTTRTGQLLGTAPILLAAGVTEVSDKSFRLQAHFVVY